MKYKFYRRMATSLIVGMLIFCNVGYAENIDPDNDGSQYAWGENVGWVNFEPSQGEGITVTDSAVIGKVWGENIGWINLSPANYGGVMNDGAGNLSGHAWGENIGWINFAPTGGGVKIDPVTGVFSGYAWGENIGWINFAPNEVPVKTSWIQGLITLLVPNGGDVLPSGGTYAICWRAPVSIVKFDLNYSIDNGTNWKLIKSVTGLNCISWAVPTVSKNEKDSRAKVIGYNAGGVQITEDTSDKPFTIEVVRVLSPNGGETLKSGDTWTIRWVTNKTVRPVSKTILKSTIDGTNWYAIKRLIGNPGSFTLKVPDVASTKTKCKVKVVLKDASGVNIGTDTSNKFFTIQP